MNSPTFEEFADFIRVFSGHSAKKNISLMTLFEKDLGITGDDGVELLVAVEKQFGVCLSDSEGSLRKTFNLAPNEYLFHGEGFSFSLFKWFSKGNKTTIREFTVGELYNVVCINKVKIAT